MPSNGPGVPAAPLFARGYQRSTPGPSPSEVQRGAWDAVGSQRTSGSPTSGAPGPLWGDFPDAALPLAPAPRGHHADTDAAHPPSPPLGTSRDCGPSQILDFLFLGGILDAHDKEFLRTNRITTIVNISTERYWGVLPDAIVHSFPIPDSSNVAIEPLFPSIFRIIDWVRAQWFRNRHRRRRMLVHCQKGRSRSATVVLAYLMRRNGWSVAEALEYVRERRPTVEPNLGFMASLRALQDSMRLPVRAVLRRRCTLTLRNVRADLDGAAVRCFVETRCANVLSVAFFSKHSDTGGQPRDDASEEDEEEEDCCASGASGPDSAGADPAPHRRDRRALCMIFFACHEHAKVLREELDGCVVPELCGVGDAVAPLRAILHSVRPSRTAGAAPPAAGATERAELASAAPEKPSRRGPGGGAAADDSEECCVRGGWGAMHSGGSSTSNDDGDSDELPAAAAVCDVSSSASHEAEPAAAY